jgi:peroxiredoxin Q/BCP
VQELVKDSGVVLFFYPKANTGGCTKQACGFKDEYKKFQDAGYKVFGMSADKPKSQLNWKTKYSLPYSFLCDPEHKVGGTLTKQLWLPGTMLTVLDPDTSTQGRHY